jgi:hypothetical protein
VLVTNHVLAGALIGRVMSRHPVGAFAVGVVSHFAMDCCPHFGDETWTRDSPEFLRLARCDGCCGLAAMALAAGLAPGRSRRAVVAAMAGAAMVDSDKPLEYLLGWNPWPEFWNSFHRRIQNEEPTRMPVEIGTGLGLAVLAYLVLRAGPR